jgi:hypothetical protein
MSPRVAVDQLDHLGAVHVSKVRMIRPHRVQRFPSALHELNAPIPRRLKFGNGFF